MRVISGTIQLPPDAPPRRSALVTVEVRDVSAADAPSTVVAEVQLRDVALQPGAAIPFRVEVPEVEPGRALSLRVHASLDGSGTVKQGDLLSTQRTPVPTRGPLGDASVPVRVV